ncbi:hypothetical protein EVAR_83193_1 [Eumeta japonica]|uniref:Uncharacterized protein n=1 Tax=Eumeta variegata TaxID=151549 RepID=A0A4C1YUG9_EUMVA|nr:hypothetical protein EVAR_83193_1 [Eumeta japonica]
MDPNFVRADNSNLPKIDAFTVAHFFKNNADYYAAELKNVKTAIMKVEKDFIKADSANLPKVDSFMIANFFASNPDFCSAEFRNVKTSVEVVYSICTSLCKILVHCQVLSYTRGEEMEAARLNLRECSLRSGPCHDEYSGSPTLSAGAVPAAPRSHGPSASRRSANCIKEYGEMFMTHIKIECNGEDPATIPTLGTARSHLQENPMSGNTLWVKEEGFEMKTEDNVHETIITEELDIGPTVLQPRIMPHSVPSSDQYCQKPYTQHLYELMVKSNSAPMVYDRGLSYLKAGDRRRLWTFATQEESSLRCRPLCRNSIFVGGESELMEGQWID